MAGSIVNPKRPRYQVNERFDTVDADAQSRAPREQSKAVMRAFSSAPRNTAGSPSAIGMIVAGFELILNPINGTDGKVRVGSGVGVAVDADGGVIIKPQGVAFDITIPTGTFQLYAYYAEDAVDNAKRRFISITSPFVESTVSINTSFQGSCLVTAISGNAASVVPEAVVNGVTTPLCCIGIVTNGGTGAITCVGYDPVSAPNGTDIVGRLSASEPTSSPPLTPFVNGSIHSVTEMLKHLAYVAGQLAWKGSSFLTPSAANNYGAYSVPAGGVDAAYRGQSGVFTIGNGSTVVGDFNTSDYARADLLLAAAVAALPADGGTLVIKRGVNLSLWNGATFSMPAGKTIEVVGSHRDVPSTSPQITFAANESLTASATGRLVLRNVHVRWVTNVVVLASNASCQVMDCFLEKNVAAADSGAAIQGAAVSDAYVQRCVFSVNLSAGTGNGMCFRVTGQARRVRIADVRLLTSGSDCGAIQVADVREDVVIDDVRLEAAVPFAGASGAAVVSVETGDNTTNIRQRIIRRISTNDAGCPAVRTTSVGNVTIEDVDASLSGGVALSAPGYSGVGPVRVVKCRGAISAATGAFPDLVVTDCMFTNGGTTVIGTSGTTAHGRVAFERCRFPMTDSGYAIQVRGTTVDAVIISDCVFSSIGHTTQRVAAILVQASAVIHRLLVRRCEFAGVQNVAWAGSNIATSCVEVNVNAANHIVVEENVATRLMSGSSGSARLGCYLLDVNSADRTSVLATVHEMVVRGNVVGDQDMVTLTDTNCMLMRAQNWLWIIHLMMSGNRLFTDYSNGVSGAPSLEHLVNIQTAGTSVTLRQVDFNNNVFHIANNGGGNLNAIAVDFYRVAKGGGTDVVFSHVMTGNNFVVDDVAPAFDGVNGFGVNVPAFAHKNLMVMSNSVSSFGSSVTWFKFNFTSSLTNFNANGGTLPASAGAFPNNIGIVRS